jgi:hypothetical protein
MANPLFQGAAVEKANPLSEGAAVKEIEMEGMETLLSG